MSEKTSEKRVYIVPVKDSEDLCFTLRDYRGNLYVDMRIFFAAEEGGKKTVASKKGLTLRLGMIDEVQKGLRLVKEASAPQATAQSVA